MVEITGLWTESSNEPFHLIAHITKMRQNQFLLQLMDYFKKVS